LGRVFSFKERMRLTVRMNFTNPLNRTNLSNPSVTSPTAATTKSSTGLLTAGFGFINYQGGSVLLPPRQGTLEMRLQF